MRSQKKKSAGDQLSRIWPGPNKAPTRTALALADKLVKDKPRSVRSWLNRGDLLQLKYFHTAKSRIDYELLLDISRCYIMALLLSNSSAPYEAIGHFFDTWSDDTIISQIAFERAIDLGGFGDAHIGLARILAQSGKKKLALSLLAKYSTTNAKKVRETSLAVLRGDWDPPTCSSVRKS